MNDRQFGIAATAVASVTVAFVCWHNGLGFWATAMWVGVVLAGALLIAVSWLISEKLAPEPHSLRQIQLIKPVGAIIVASGLAVLGLVTANVGLAIGSIVALAVFGFLAYAIWRSDTDRDDRE